MTCVLLVDDKVENLEYLGAMLKGHGFESELATNGVEALAKGRLHPPDAIISDLLMPLMDGYTLLRHWKADAALQRIPFIIYTATYTDAEDEGLARDLGADAFLLKPSEPEVIMQQLREVLSQKIAARVSAGDRPRGDETAFLQQYNQVLIHKLESKTRQLEKSNRELMREIFERGQIAQTQIAILNALPARVALLDETGVIVSVNDSWRQFAADNGMTSPDFGVGDNYLSVCAGAPGPFAEEASRVAAGLEAVLAGAAPAFAYEYPSRSPGENSWFRMMVTPLQSDRASGAVVMHVDVSDRKGAEQRLRDSQDQYLLLLNSTTEGIYGLDIGGLCTFCNLSAARFLGFQDPHELVGRRMHDQHHHIRPDKSAAVGECRVHGSFKGGLATHGDDEVFFRKDGSQFPVEYWTHPIRKGADVIGAVVAFLDISERKDLEAQFLQSQKMEAIGRLAGGVAHDFNNALQVVMTCSELLDDHLDGRPLERQYVREIQAASEQAATLTRSLLAFSRKQLVNPVLLDLNVVIDRIHDMLRRMVGEDIRVVTMFDPQLCTIEADPGQLEQILMNLAVNARDAMPLGGEIFIRTSTVDLREESRHPHTPLPPGRFALLTVGDTGCGMDARTRSKVFEPFFTTKETGKGTGLGLSTVYGIVEQSGGHIELDSAAGEGTVFRIYFPAAAGAPPRTLDMPRTDQQSGGSETILLVEDEPALLSLVGMTLRANGYRVLEAHCGADGVSIGRNPEVQIDLLVTDVRLPDFGGPEVAGRLLRVHPTLRILYISGYTDGSLSLPNVADGAFKLLEKPFSIDSLLAKIRATLDGTPAAGG